MNDTQNSLCHSHVSHFVWESLIPGQSLINLKHNWSRPETSMKTECRFLSTRSSIANLRSRKCYSRETNSMKLPTFLTRPVVRFTNLYFTFLQCCHEQENEDENNERSAHSMSSFDKINAQPRPQSSTSIRSIGTKKNDTVVKSFSLVPTSKKMNKTHQQQMSQTCCICIRKNKKCDTCNDKNSKMANFVRFRE